MNYPNQLDSETKQAWEDNWKNISIDTILEIFTYERVKKQIDLLLSVLPKKCPILEGGCGIGPYLIYLRRKGYFVEGIDYNKSVIEKMLKYDSTLPVKEGNILRIEYPDNYFGGYISLGVLEHLKTDEEVVKAVEEAFRVLKDHGVFFVMIPKKYILGQVKMPITFLARNNFIRRIFHKPIKHYYYERYFNISWFCCLLKDSAFHIESIHPLDHSHGILTFSRLFRDKTKYDEINTLGLKISHLFERIFPIVSATHFAIICYKKTRRIISCP